MADVGMETISVIKTMTMTKIFNEGGRESRNIGRWPVMIIFP